MSESAEQFAQVMGLEPHLTVPSRGDKTRVDLWFALRRCAAGQVWEERFREVVAKQQHPLWSSARVEAVPFTPQNGWIVVRDVDPRYFEFQDVEELVCETVRAVNETLCQPQLVLAPSVAAPTPVRGTSTSLIGVVARVRDYLERRRAIEEATSRVREPLARHVQQDYNTDSGASLDAAESVA